MKTRGDYGCWNGDDVYVWLWGWISSGCMPNVHARACKPRAVAKFNRHVQIVLQAAAQVPQERPVCVAGCK